MKKTGLLLINLGTPSSPNKASVKAFLKQFLSDPRVIDLANPLRWLLVNGYILPSRARASSKLYQSIWTERGSPLLLHSQALCEKVQAQLRDQCIVKLGMRYGQPSIQQALEKLLAKNISHLKILPLLPQYASATTGSAIEACFNGLKTKANIPSIEVIHDFYNHPAYLYALQQSMQEQLITFKPDHILFSYHGIPERQIKKSEDSKATHCDLDHSCPAIISANRFCYRAQCHATSRLLAKTLSLEGRDVSTCFQSRLGRIPWIKPYTDELMTQLAAQGVKRLSIACPSFVADCLETLEEINIRGREQWQALGGSAFQFIPCLNSNSAWVNAVSNIAGLSKNFI